MFWVRVPRNRDGFERELMRLRARSPIVPWVVRRAVLQNPDSVMSDVSEILNDARKEIEAGRMDARVQWAFGLIVTVRGACQLVTAAAHADEYPRFGAQLLQSTSRDLRSFLDGAAAKLRDPEDGR